MKIVTNAKESACTACLSIGTADLDNAGKVVCSLCGSRNLIDEQGYIFQPVFEPGRFYQASPYGPKLPDRRRVNKPWPKIREQRAGNMVA
jgi:hypothetical protein